MIDTLNIAFLAVALTSCGLISDGDRDSDRWYGSCGEYTVEEGPLERADPEYHVTATPPELAQVLDASLTYQRYFPEEMTLVYAQDGATVTVVYGVQNTP